MWDRRRVLWLCGMVLACAVVALAQTEEELAKTAFQAPFDTIAVMSWLMYGASYLIVYSAVLCISLTVFQLFPGFDISTYIWILLLWVGGMVIATFGHIYITSQPLAIVASVPAVFILSTVLARIYDLTWRDAARVSLIVALALGAYVTPPWKTAVHNLLPNAPAITAPAAGDEAAEGAQE